MFSILLSIYLRVEMPAHTITLSLITWGIANPISQVAAPFVYFLNWAAWFIIIKIWKFFTYTRHKSFIRYVLCKYFLLLIFLTVSFQKQNFLFLNFKLSLLYGHCPKIYCFIYYSGPLAVSGKKVNPPSWWEAEVLAEDRE